ncbi:MAG TPA: hypothetical protein H9768_09410 [Candidatus Mailhella merdavium]|nr:hypothetical protein [Candidatus Mailhella merdavium]
MNLSLSAKILLLRLIALGAALWLIFLAPVTGPALLTRDWEHISPSVPFVLVVMLICWWQAKRMSRAIHKKPSHTSSR